MTPREIIAEAWAITVREHVLRRWGFFSSFFETLLTAKLVSYQVYFLWEWMHGTLGGFFDVEIMIYNTLPHWFFWTFVLTFVFLFIIELFIPSFAKGAIIGLTAKAYQKEEMKGGLVLAVYNFFPMFAVHELFVLGSIATTITICSLVLRYVEGDVKYYMIGIVVFFWILSNILEFLASFAQPAIVIKRVSIFEGIGQSFKLILSFLGHVMFLWLLLFVISIRIAFNAAIVLLIPGIAVGIGLALANVLSPVVTYSIAIGVGVLLILIASYFFAYLHVFRDAVWTITYFELKKHKDLLVIGE
ncbi:MAG: hypothetical protein PHW10_04065 [Candidatus Peribacteraceae bacterium]|nr:hypothetical protein [Candidatus Peribacteraceae bacterium]